MGDDLNNGLRERRRRLGRGGGGKRREGRRLAPPSLVMVRFERRGLPLPLRPKGYFFLPFLLFLSFLFFLLFFAMQITPLHERFRSTNR